MTERMIGDLPEAEFWRRVKDWHPWFAWRPVILLTMEIAWLRMVIRRPNMSGGSGKWDYANP